MPQTIQVVNNGYTDAWSGFSYSDGVNSNNIILFLNSTYYISPVTSYSPTADPKIPVITFGDPNIYLDFSGCCSGDTFSFWMDSSVLSFTIGKSYRIKEAISWTNYPSDNLCGCFTLVSSSSTSPSYTLYSAINVGDIFTDFTDCLTCESSVPCSTSACCINMLVVSETGSYTIPLTPDGCLIGFSYYTFNNLYGEPMVLYLGKGPEWKLSNLFSGKTAGEFGTSTDCPSGSATTNSYTHLTNGSGILYLNSAPCEPPPLECSPTYCIQGTGFDYDDTYSAVLGEEYNGTGYWSGQSNGYVIYYSSADTQWCLSLTLGGTCLLSGKSPCTTTCPDLCEHYFYEGICPSTTTTTTINCSTFDFSAVFDCEVFPTTTTTTSTSTTTTTTLPPPDPCSGVSISATINTYTTTTTTSNSTTTTTTIYYPCNFSGDVTFNTIDVEIKCPISKEFKDCYDMGGTRYYTNDILTNPMGGDIEVDMVFLALVDGELKCISYVGINNDVSPINTITLVDGSFGNYPEGCETCVVPPQPICFSAGTEASGVPLGCTLYPTGINSGYPYFQMVDPENCSTPLVGYVVWYSASTSQWVLTTDGLNGSNVASTLTSGVSLAPSGIWSSTGEPSTLDILSSFVGECPTTTTTTTTTTIPCYCYALVSSKFNTFTYTDCNGNSQTQVVGADNGVVYVCSRTEPISDTTQGTATLSESCPTSSNNCTLPPCYCYSIRNTFGRPETSTTPATVNSFVSIDCDGNPQLVSINYGETKYYCSRIKPAPVNNGGFSSTVNSTTCTNCGLP